MIREPPGLIVKNTGTWIPAGSGKGGRSVGIGVMLNCVTGSPLRSRMRVCVGRRSSRPGIRGVVTDTSPVVGAEIVAAFAMSSLGIQMVYPKGFVLLAEISTPALKIPYVPPGRLAVLPSIFNT